jgi:hypothetical protein
MAILLDENTILHEDGKKYPLDKTPKDTRIWSAWNDQMIDIWKNKKIGELLVYAEDPIRWRKTITNNDHYWGTTANGQDVYLLKTNSFPDKPEEALHAFVEWRNWIEEYGAKASGTVASVSWSIWKATLSKSFVSPTDWPKAVKFPIGGRLVPCREENSCFMGDFVQWDMQAAYAKRLGSILFGGDKSKWIEVNDRSHYAEMAAKGIPVYVVARVWVPRMKYGPLPQRRQKYSPFSHMPINYWTNKQIYGTWTFQEIEQAELVGCSVTIERVWVHAGGEASFRKWWEIIEEGRDNLIGFSKYLAKSTGNSLWGQFAFREKPRKVRWYEEGKRHHRIILPRLADRPKSPELSDQLSGQIRADLYRFLVTAEDELLQANTDGAWVIETAGFKPPDIWRVKKRAHVMQFIDASTYRYWQPGETEPSYVMAGVPFDVQTKAFDSVWRKLETS